MGISVFFVFTLSLSFADQAQKKGNRESEQHARDSSISSPT